MFKEKRFGMFIHWGLYAISGWHEQELWRLGKDEKEYQNYMKSFSPTRYNPEEWVKLAKAAGMDYICFTTKHHDGFSMWDTKFSDYKVTNTPFGKDVLALLAEACRKNDMALSIYYSVPDWHHPSFPNFGGNHELPCPKTGDEPNEEKYIEYVKNQITELLTNYGKIQSFFWDIPPKTRDTSVNALIRKLQPHIYINNRGYDEGDFATPERMTPEGGAFEKLTEGCNSVGRQSWGYRKNEDYFSNLILTSAIDSIMARGGNYLLNVGPDENGQIPLEAVETIKAVGKWYKSVKEALYATPKSYSWCAEKGFLATERENTLYLHLPKCPEASGFFLENIVELPKCATVLNDSTPLSVSMDIMPTLCRGENANHTPVFHVNGIPVNRLANEIIILKLEFENLSEAVLKEDIKTEENRF